MKDKYIEPHNRGEEISVRDRVRMLNFYGLAYAEQNGSADLRFKNFGVIHKDVLNDPRYKYKKDDENLMIPLNIHRFARPSTYEHILYAREKNFFINRYQKLFYFNIRYHSLCFYTFLIFILSYIFLESNLSEPPFVPDFSISTISLLFIFYNIFTLPSTLFEFLLKKDIKEVAKLGWDKRLDLYYGWKNPWVVENFRRMDRFGIKTKILKDKLYIKKPYTKEEIEVCKHNDYREKKWGTVNPLNRNGFPILFLIILIWLYFTLS